MTINTYNSDKRYEMLSAILPGKNENTPDAETVVEDLQEILRLCYVWTTDAGGPKEATASDLANAIVGYLFAEWTPQELDFEKWAKEYWAPFSKPVGAAPTDESDISIDQPPSE